jgi:outer membrane immunogenic protein
MFGWVAGLGVEARLWDTNWLGRLEYLHYDFGVSDGSFSEVDTTGGVVTFTSNNTSGRLTTDVVRAALSYKFDWPPAGAGSVARGVMPLKAPARVAAWSWSGFYLGGNVGYGWGRDPFTEDINLDHGGPFVKLFGVDSKSLLGGFQAGANWQYDTAWMGGLEIDLGSGIKGSGTNTASVTTGVGAAATTFTNTVTQTDKFDLLGSGRARVGYLPWPNAMLYGTGGLAWTRLVTTQDTFALSASGGNPANTNTVAISTTNPSWEFGWVAGVGGEARLLDTNWLVRIEYLHYDFGARASNFEVFAIAGAPTQTFGTTTGHLTIDAVRAGFDYKFD